MLGFRKYFKCVAMCATSALRVTGDVFPHCVRTRVCMHVRVCARACAHLHAKGKRRESSGPPGLRFPWPWPRRRAFPCPGQEVISGQNGLVDG